jgi:hypothetical protein
VVSDIPWWKVVVITQVDDVRKKTTLYIRHESSAHALSRGQRLILADQGNADLVEAWCETWDGEWKPEDADD